MSRTPAVITRHQLAVYVRPDQRCVGLDKDNLFDLSVIMSFLSDRIMDQFDNADHFVIELMLKVIMCLFDETRCRHC